MNKKEYEEPQIEIINLINEDIITASGDDVVLGDDELPIKP